MPAHHSDADKVAAARRLRDEIGIAREILIDDLAGTVHRAYGMCPNMTWVLGRGGQVLYKAMWTSAAQRLLGARQGGPRARRRRR